jgi:hypothetical protein
MDNEAEKGMAFEAKDGIRRTPHGHQILIFIYTLSYLFSISFYINPASLLLTTSASRIPG